jgi:hypothetical protein
MVPYTIPFLGNTIAYGVDPIKFLMDCKAKVYAPFNVIFHALFA